MLRGSRASLGQTWPTCLDNSVVRSSNGEVSERGVTKANQVGGMEGTQGDLGLSRRMNVGSVCMYS